MPLLPPERQVRRGYHTLLDSHLIEALAEAERLRAVIRKAVQDFKRPGYEPWEALRKALT